MGSVTESSSSGKYLHPPRVERLNQFLVVYGSAREGWTTDARRSRTSDPKVVSVVGEGERDSEREREREYDGGGGGGGKKER
jgi:hypothetical protein